MAKAEKKLPDLPEYYLYWAYQNRENLRLPLHTTEGWPLEILYPGRRNQDNGPDFREALLRINRVQIRGDVEFHLRWQDWFDHGHHHDCRYENVVLHILWYPPEGLPAELARRFSHLVLSGFLDRPAAEWLKIMEKLHSPEAVGSSPFPELSLGEVEKLAWSRFRRKCEEIKDWVNTLGWETALYMGLARSLGYSKNSQPFLNLVRALPPSQLLHLVYPLQRSPLVFWIILCYQGGLLTRPFKQAPLENHSPQKQLVQRICRQFSTRLPPRKMSLTQWQFSRVRPFNNPYFRVAGFAQIVFDTQQQSLSETLLEIVSARQPLAVLLQQLEEVLCCPLSKLFQPYLQTLLGLKQTPSRAMGKMRFGQFFLNILLPFAYLWSGQQSSSGFRIYLEDVFYQMPPPDDNRILRRSANTNRYGIEKAYIQQGLLEYHLRKFCEQPPDIRTIALTSPA